MWTAGAQKIAISEAKWLRKIGYEADLLFLRGRPNREYEELLQDTSYVIYSSSGKSPFTPIYSYITGKFMPDRKSEGRIDYNLIRAFPKIIKNKGYDMVICHDSWAGLAGYYAKMKLGIPYKIVVHERVVKYKVRILGKLANNFENKVLRNANEIFAVTDDVADSIVSLYGYNSKTLLPGIEIKEFNSYMKRKKILLTVAFWDRGRYPEVYLKLLKLLDDYDLIIAGNWRDKEFFKEFTLNVNTLKEKNRIKILTGLNEIELGELFKQSKFFVRFGFQEHGLGTANLEAISYGLPVIVNSTLGFSKIVKLFGAGFVANGEFISDLFSNKTDWYTSNILLNSNLSERLNLDEIAEFIKLNDNVDDYTKLQVGCREISNKLTWKEHCNQLMTLNSNS